MSDISISKELIPLPISLDYAVSDDPMEIDKGIRATINGMRLSILALGLSLARIKEKQLYRELGCTSMSRYIEKLSADTKMDRGNFFKWLRIGSAYLKYKDELDAAGFTDTDGPTKLPYLEQALGNNEKQTVFDNIKNMSVREFVNFAKMTNVIDASAVKGGKWVVTEKENSIYIDGKLAIIISSKVSARASAYFKRVIHVACEALRDEGVIFPVQLQNMKDARRFEPAVERLKSELGMK
jgi:hypothetical protein